MEGQHVLVDGNAGPCTPLHPGRFFPAVDGGPRFTERIRLNAREQPGPARGRAPFEDRGSGKQRTPASRTRLVKHLHCARTASSGLRRRSPGSEDGGPAGTRGTARSRPVTSDHEERVTGIPQLLPLAHVCPRQSNFVRNKLFGLFS